LLQILELSIVDFQSCNNLTIEEPESLNLVTSLVELLSDEREADLSKRYFMIVSCLNLVCLAFRKRKVISLDCLALELDWELA